MDLSAVRLHQELAVWLLVERRAHHPDLKVNPELGACERERASPLAGAGLSRELSDAVGGVVVGLGNGGIRLVRAGRAHALVLVVNLRRGAKILLEPPCPEQRRWPP